MEKVIEAPMLDLMATIAEAQLYRKWVPTCRKSKIHGKKSNFRQMGEFEFNLPWPF
jgi:hypothetical protein